MAHKAFFQLTHTVTAKVKKRFVAIAGDAVDDYALRTLLGTSVITAGSK